MKKSVSKWVAERIKRNKKDFKLEFYTASVGAGGGGKDTSNTACRITDKKTGLSAEHERQRSQKANKEAAFLKLVDKLIEYYKAEELRSKTEELSNSERVRTYEVKGAKVHDDRLPDKTYDMDKVLNGKMDNLLGDLMRRGND